VNGERARAAISLFRSGFSCSQAVLASFADLFGLEEEQMLRISQPFGGGIAHRGDICGAVSGALMVLGLKHGRTKAEDLASRDKTYAAVDAFLRKFVEIHGSFLCRELLGRDMSSPAAWDRAREEGLFATLCPRFVRQAAEILEEMLD